MEKTVKSCGECPFNQEGDPMYDGWCGHPDGNFPIKYIRKKKKPTIHPNCPEKGPFIITTKKIEDDKS